MNETNTAAIHWHQAQANTMSLNTCLYYFLLLAVFGSCTGKDTKVSGDLPRNIEVFFLGHDSQHHDSEMYLPILASSLARSGINFTYTSNPNDLRSEILEDYDALMIYANHDSITSTQEKTLLEYVSSGKGLLAIHSASYCFRNSDEYISLVGAQFLSHDTATFTPQITNRDHPITNALEHFTSWDETYLHQKHNTDRIVLMEREEGDSSEPWTWVREYGQGRVFYTASGHDERTWRQPEFQELIKQAILWCIPEQVRILYEELPEFPVPEYMEAKIPNYEQRDPPPKYQLPLSPENSQRLTQVPPGFNLSLFASEPDIINPISMAWDEKGRLWVIETVDYPNTVTDEEGTGDDRIKICEDTDGDGKADKFTVFARNLNIPTSLVFSNGGVIVAQAPHFLFLKDEDGDDVADVREIFLTGWGTFDTHAGPSNLKYGHDNHIWGCVGYSGFKGIISGQPQEFSQGFYRFSPDLSDFEVMTSTSNNTWGLALSEDFQVFGSTANNTHSVFLGIPDKYYQGIKGLPGYGSKKIDGHYAFHPITHNVRQVDVFGGFTAAAGHNLYTARSFPKKYWNRIAFVNAPTGRLIHQAILEPNGSGYREKDGWNIVASNDEWFGPVHAEVGPDGALWILDWYNFIIQHNPTPPGFENGPGNAHINPLRDRSHGRIYRLAYTDMDHYEPIQLNKTEPDQLVETLQHPNLFWRLTAQRLLVERNSNDINSALVRLIKKNRKDELGLYPSVLHALWTLQGLGQINEKEPSILDLVIRALEHPAPSIRRAAIMILPRTEKPNQILAESAVIDDPNANVKLAALLALSETEPSVSVGRKLYTMSKNANILEDPWLPQAIYIAAVKHQEGFLAAYSEDSDIPMTSLSAVQNSHTWKHLTAFPDWQSQPLPGLYKDNGLNGWDGIIWYSRIINIPGELIHKNASVSLGTIDDSDSTFINGIYVGSKYNASTEFRLYQVPPGILKPGNNTITVKTEDTGGRGGFIGQDTDMQLKVGTRSFALAGNWYYKIEREFPNRGSKIFTENRGIVQVLLENISTVNPTEVIRGTDAEFVSLELGVVINEMKYDKEILIVEQGTTIEITFKNQDFMQHNLLIIQPGTLEIVGAAADRLATSPEGADKQYIPELKEVLHSTPLLDPQTSTKLKFKVPDEPGDYPYVCTFPGHWRTMNGILRVVETGNL